MASNSLLSWSETLHAQTITCIETFNDSFKNKSDFVVKFEIVKKAPLCTFAEVNFGHVKQGYNLSKMKLMFYIFRSKDLEILQSILEKIQVEFNSLENRSSDTDSD